MKTCRSLSACLLTLVTLPVMGFSQSVKKDEPAAADAAKPRVIDTLKIKNLTYGDLIELLRKETGENIILSPVLQNEMAPEIVMRHVTLEGVLGAICMVTGLAVESREDEDTVIWNIRPQLIDETRTWQNAPKAKICRVFKASAKEKLDSSQLDALLANLYAAAEKIREVNNRAQGHSVTDTPVIEAHAGTGIVIVAGTESDVQLLGQVIQAVGGEVVPLTTSVVEFDGFIPSSVPVTSVETAGTRGSNTVTGGTLLMSSSSSVPVNLVETAGTHTQPAGTAGTLTVTAGSSPPASTKAPDGMRVGQVVGNLVMAGNSSPQSVVKTPEGTGIVVTGVTLDTTQVMEDTRKRLEAARAQVKTLESQLDMIRQQTPPAPPTAK